MPKRGISQGVGRSRRSRRSRRGGRGGRGVRGRRNLSDHMRPNVPKSWNTSSPLGASGVTTPYAWDISCFWNDNLGPDFPPGGDSAGEYEVPCNEGTNSGWNDGDTVPMGSGHLIHCTVTSQGSCPQSSFSSGGRVRQNRKRMRKGGSPYIVGEKGPELFVPTTAAMGKYYDPYDKFSAYGPRKFAGGGGFSDRDRTRRRPVSCIGGCSSHGQCGDGCACRGPAGNKTCQKRGTATYGGGGRVLGPSHEYGGVPALVGGKRPIELEGDEFVMPGDAVAKYGLDRMEAIRTGKAPRFAEGGAIMARRGRGINNKNKYDPYEMFENMYGFPESSALSGKKFKHDGRSGIKRRQYSPGQFVNPGKGKFARGGYMGARGSQCPSGQELVNGLCRRTTRMGKKFKHGGISGFGSRSRQCPPGQTLVNGRCVRIGTRGKKYGRGGGLGLNESSRIMSKHGYGSTPGMKTSGKTIGEEFMCVTAVKSKGCGSGPRGSYVGDWYEDASGVIKGGIQNLSAGIVPHEKIPQLARISGRR